MKLKKIYGLRSTAQCDPDSDNACVRSMNGHCIPGQILDERHWRFTDINAAYRKVESYNTKSCGCRVEIVELEPVF